jgi:hypothetical protein
MTITKLSGEDYTTSEIQLEIQREASEDISDCLARIKQREMHWSLQ